MPHNTTGWKAMPAGLGGRRAGGCAAAQWWLVARCTACGLLSPAASPPQSAHAGHDWAASTPPVRPLVHVQCAADTEPKYEQTRRVLQNCSGQAELHVTHQWQPSLPKTAMLFVLRLHTTWRHPQYDMAYS